MESDDQHRSKRKSARAGVQPRPYEVGYGKPPEHTRFGRRPQPHRQKNANEGRSLRKPDIAGQLDRLVDVKLGRRATKLHPQEAMLHSLFAKAARGQLQAIKQLLREFDRAGLLEAEILQQSSCSMFPETYRLTSQASSSRGSARRLGARQPCDRI